MICANVCFGIVGALLVQLFIPKSTTISTVNITGLVDSFVKETAKQSLTSAEMEQKVNQFGEQLQQTIVQLAKQKNTVLLPNEAVIAGTNDLTGEVEKRIKGRKI